MDIRGRSDLMEKIAKEINESIKESEIYKRYLISKEKLDNNKELCLIRNKLELLKKENCRSKEEVLINEYYELEKKYKSHVLVKEYEKNKSDVYDLLLEVCDILWFK